MAYRNKTYVCFASEDVTQYYLMEAWKMNTHIGFNFHDAHDLRPLMSSSSEETIRRRLRERLANTKQAVLLLGSRTKAVAGDSDRFLHYELEVLCKLNIPIVVANLNQSREIQTAKLPAILNSPYYTISTSFQPTIIQHALDDYVANFQSNLTSTKPRRGPHYYLARVYQSLCL